jgi:hypothetical protein
MKTIALILGLTTALPAQQPKQERDYSSPVQRLVGRWTSANLSYRYHQCDYFGPVDIDTHTGEFIRYSLAKDIERYTRNIDTKKTVPNWKIVQSGKDAWRVYSFKYQIINEDPDGERVTVKLLFGDGSRTESYYIEHDGSVRTGHSVITGFELNIKNVYMDDTNQTCDVH